MASVFHSDSERSTLLVHAYIDGELDPVNTIAVKQQIAADPALAAERSAPTDYAA